MLRKPGGALVLCAGGPGARVGVSARGTARALAPLLKSSPRVLASARQEGAIINSEAAERASQGRRSASAKISHVVGAVPSLLSPSGDNRGIIEGILPSEVCKSLITLPVTRGGYFPEVHIAQSQNL